MVRISKRSTGQYELEIIWRIHIKTKAVQYCILITGSILSAVVELEKKVMKMTQGLTDNEQ